MVTREKRTGEDMAHDYLAFYRGRWKGLVNLLENVESDESVFMLPRMAENPDAAYAVRAGVLLGFVTVQGDQVKLTRDGFSLIHSTSVEEPDIVRSALLAIPRMRMTFEILRDQFHGRSFKAEDLAPVLRNMEPGLPAARPTLEFYCQKLMSWFKAAQLVGRGPKNSYIFTGKNGQRAKDEPKSQDLSEWIGMSPVADTEITILRLNALVADLLSDTNHKIVMGDVNDLLTKLDASELADEGQVSWLRREFELAVETHDRTIISLVGRSLRDLRRRYVLRSSPAPPSQAGSEQKEP